MPNYFVSYDLNGQHPTHAEMDEYLKKLGNCVMRVLGTVWYVKYMGDQQSLREHIDKILSEIDSVLVIEADGCRWRNLLVSDRELMDCWND